MVDQAKVKAGRDIFKYSEAKVLHKTPNKIIITLLQNP